MLVAELEFHPVPKPVERFLKPYGLPDDDPDDQAEQSDDDVFGLHYHLDERHSYYRNILENPALTQSSEFTEMVMKIYLMWEELDCRTDLYNLDLEEKHYLGELLTEIYQELVEYWLDNAYNHSIHNRPRLHRLIETSPFVQ